MLAVGFHKGTLDGHDGDTKSFRMDWDPASKLKRLSGVVFRKDEEHFACHGYGATRRMGAGALSGKVSSLNESLFQEDVPLRNAEEWLLQADYAASKAPAREKFAKANRDRIVQVLLDLLPDIDEITFVAPGPGVPVARVEFRTPYGFVGMRDLSLGYRTLIAWMVDLASRLFERYPESANPLAEPAVVLVDEIDLHLHPAWQRRLMSYLREHFPKTQFIVTAHSPLVVQSAADANIVVLRKEGDHVIIDNNPASVKGWRVDQILTSDLFGLSSARSPQLESLLQKRTQLLSKARLSASDKARVKELDAQIGFLPTGETQNEREALEIIQRFAQRVHKEGV
nr:AAA family ATPase [Corallococcus sicarius]